MKGARAKKAAAEKSAAATSNGAPAELEPTPPSGAREGHIVSSASRVQIPAADFKRLIELLRTSELLGAAAADAFEAAAGLRLVASPQSKGAKELRGEVAASREDDAEATSKTKKKGMCFDDGPVGEIPDLPEEARSSSKKRVSLTEADIANHESEELAQHCEKDAADPPELNLTPKQNHMRTDLEMWVMDEIPTVFGVDDSEELAENLQEDGQADQITFLIAEASEESQDAMAGKWLAGAPDPEAKADFAKQLLEKVRAIQALSIKKKKKKKKADA